LLDGSLVICQNISMWKSALGALFISEKLRCKYI
jgi:hypothetical protein